MSFRIFTMIQESLFLVIHLLKLSLVLVLIGLVLKVARVAYVLWFYRNHPTRDTGSILGEFFNANLHFPYLNRFGETPMYNLVQNYIYSDQYPGVAIIWMAWKPYALVNTYTTVEAAIKGRNNQDKPFSYKFLDPRLYHGLIGVNGKKWSQRRRMYLPAFKKKNLVHYYQDMTDIIGRIVDSVKLDAVDGVYQFGDIKKPVHLMVLDVLAPFVMGKRFNFFYSPDSILANSSLNLCKPIMHRAVNPLLQLDLIFSTTQMGKSMRSNLTRLYKFYSDTIQAKTKEKFCDHENNYISKGESQVSFQVWQFEKHLHEKSKSLLETFLECVYIGGIGIRKSFLGLQDVQDEIANSLSAGIETTTNAVTWILVMLGMHGDVQNKVYEEVADWDEFLASRGDIETALQNCQFLDQCIKETLRLFPPVPIIARNVAQDTELAGYKLLKDTELLIPVFLVHRDPSVYEEPNEFRPERFGPQSPSPPPFSFLPFSAGSRDCVGKSLAMSALKLMVGIIISNFKISSLKAFHEIPIELSMTTEPVCKLPMKFERRSRATIKSTLL